MYNGPARCREKKRSNALSQVMWCQVKERILQCKDAPSISAALMVQFNINMQGQKPILSPFTLPFATLEGSCNSCS